LTLYDKVLRELCDALIINSMHPEYPRFIM